MNHALLANAALALAAPALANHLNIDSPESVVIYVDDDAPPGGDGLAWSTAFNSLHDALQLARNTTNHSQATEVWIAAGIYPTDTDNDPARTFLLDVPLTLRGGFLGSELHPSQRQPPAHALEAVLTGEIGDPDTTEDNARHVVTVTGPGPVTIDRLTITAGNAAGQGADRNGGGIHADDTQLAVLDARIINNAAQGEGGGIYADDTTLTVINSTIAGNRAGTSGGGITARDDTDITDSLVEGNTAGIGGGLALCCGDITVHRTTVSGNTASLGGGVAATVGAVAIIESTIENNAASRGGGLFVNAFQPTTLLNTRVRRNTASEGGGVLSETQLLVANALLVRNTALLNGGALDLRGNADIVNTLVYGNSTVGQAAGLFHRADTTNIRNSLIYANTENDTHGEPAQIRTLAGTLLITHSGVQGWTGALGDDSNRPDDPRFVDPAGPDGVLASDDDDFSLGELSWAIDAGDSTALPADLFDLDADGITDEPIARDAVHLPRLRDDPAVPDTGVPADMGQVVDVGPIEHLNTCLGDVNGDNTVDLDDFSALAVQFGATAPPGQLPADLDQNGVVNLDDFSILAVTFGQAC